MRRSSLSYQTGIEWEARSATSRSTKGLSALAWDTKTLPTGDIQTPCVANDSVRPRRHIIAPVGVGRNALFGDGSGVSGVGTSPSALRATACP